MFLLLYHLNNATEGTSPGLPGDVLLGFGMPITRKFMT
jgi:hypothetical protein